MAVSSNCHIFVKLKKPDTMKTLQVLKSIKRNTDVSLTDNQSEFFDHLHLSVSNLFGDVEINNQTTLMYTEMPNNTTSWNLTKVWEIKHDDFMLCFAPYGKRSFELHKIEVYKQGNGIGTRLMKLINEYSLETKTTIFLRPTDYKNTTSEQLRKFYKSLSFKRCDNSLYWSNIQIFK